MRGRAISLFYALMRDKYEYYICKKYYMNHLTISVVISDMSYKNPVTPTSPYVKCPSIPSPVYLNHRDGIITTAQAIQLHPINIVFSSPL